MIVNQKLFKLYQKQCVVGPGHLIGRDKTVLQFDQVFNFARGYTGAELCFTNVAVQPASMETFGYVLAQDWAAETITTAFEQIAKFGNSDSNLFRQTSHITVDASGSEIKACVQFFGAHGGKVWIDMNHFMENLVDHSDGYPATKYAVLFLNAILILTYFKRSLRSDIYALCDCDSLQNYNSLYWNTIRSRWSDKLITYYEKNKQETLVTKMLRCHRAGAGLYDPVTGEIGWHRTEGCEALHNSTKGAVCVTSKNYQPPGDVVCKRLIIHLSARYVPHATRCNDF